MFYILTITAIIQMIDQFIKFMFQHKQQIFLL